MANRVFPDLTKLRTIVNQLIDLGRVRVHKHARASHPELEAIEQIAIVRYGGQIRADKNRAPESGVYVCWAELPARGLCRAAFCVEESASGDVVVVITAFQE